MYGFIITTAGEGLLARASAGEGRAAHVEQGAGGGGGRG